MCDVSCKRYICVTLQTAGLPKRSDCVLGLAALWSTIASHCNTAAFSHYRSAILQTQACTAARCGWDKEKSLQRQSCRLLTLSLTVLTFRKLSDWTEITCPKDPHVDPSFDTCIKKPEVSWCNLQRVKGCISINSVSDGIPWYTSAATEACCATCIMSRQSVASWCDG